MQAFLVQYLASQGYLIRSVADTATKQRGKDIIAEKDGILLWVSVKGYPRGTKKTQPSTQAGHWFKDVMFDVNEYRGENDEADLAVALPEFPRYRALSDKITWFQAVPNFAYFWIQANGDVIVE